MRIEIENALEQEKLVIPVLVKGAQMPPFADLPESIAELQWLNLAEIRRKPDLEPDCARLAEGIKQALSVTESEPPLVVPKKSPSSTLSLPPVPSILPQPFEWIHIPAGTVTLTKDIWEDSYIAEGTARDFHVSEFVIAKYPITKAQYAVFKNEGYPSGQGEHPVTKVTWYDALNFCTWLSEKISLPITLPTEQQWQRAAQGDTGWEYPWGDKFDSSRCNIDESGIRTTTPVTQYPTGVSPYGVLDMSGNVDEWTLTDWETGRNDGDINNENPRVVRGGSFNDDSYGATCASRNNLNPDPNWGSYGIRVVCSPLS